MRRVFISELVQDKLDDLESFLKNGLKLSKEAARRRTDRMDAFLSSLTHAADYPLCRFKKWREAGYRCAVFERGWVFAYEVFDEGILVRDMSHSSLLAE